MAKVRDIKRHISSVNKIRQITKAMYAISMTRVYKAKQQLLQARSYTQAQTELLRVVLDRVDPTNPWLQATGQGKYVFVINSDRGMCGRFKGDLNRKAESLLKGDAAAKLLIGGDKADIYFRKSHLPIAQKFIHLYDKPTFEHAQQITNDLLTRYREDRIPVQVVYMRYLNDFRQVLEVEPLLPLTLPEPEDRPEVETPEYVYEPSQEAIFESVAPQYLRAQVFRMILESKTSEHAIRRQAMRKATDNADQLIQDLTLQFNKARQQEITKQLLDIMGGAEALR
jgi:F-type H+-transporting ATPase subunit gamma